MSDGRQDMEPEPVAPGADGPSAADLGAAAGARRPPPRGSSLDRLPGLIERAARRLGGTEGGPPPADGAAAAAEPALPPRTRAEPPPVPVPAGPEAERARSERSAIGRDDSTADTAEQHGHVDTDAGPAGLQARDREARRERMRERRLRRDALEPPPIDDGEPTFTPEDVVMPPLASYPGLVTESDLADHATTGAPPGDDPEDDPPWPAASSEAAGRVEHRTIEEWPASADVPAQQGVRPQSEVADLHRRVEPVGGAFAAALQAADRPQSRTAYDEHAARSPVPGVRIDLDRLARLGFVTRPDERTTIGREYRRIREMLLADAFVNSRHRVLRGNLIMVTSARRGEGKSFTALNLALSTALDVGREVVLVDCDPARSSFAEHLGVRSGPGLQEALLRDEADPDAALVPTDIPGLLLLPPGAGRPLPAAVLSGAAMGRLIDAMLRDWGERLVVFDAPAALEHPDAVRHLAARVGQAVLVIESGRTTRALAARALACIEFCGHVGVVLNRGRPLAGPADFPAGEALDESR